MDAPLIRTTIELSAANGLRKRSEIMVDEAMSVRRDKIEPVIGRLDAEIMLAITRALATFLGFGWSAGSALLVQRAPPIVVRNVSKTWQARGGADKQRSPLA